MNNKKAKIIVSFVCALVLLGSYILQVYPLQKVDAQNITEITPVYLPGFQHITTSDFVDSEGSVMPSETYYSPASFYMAERDSFDKTLLSLKLKYLAGGSDNRIEMAGTTNNSGFILYPNSTGTQLWFNVLVWDENAMVASPGNYFYIAFSATDAGVTSFINNEFIFQLSFEYGEFNGDHSNDDMRLGFYINGKRCQDTDGNSEIIIPGCKFEKFGDCLNVGQYDKYITVESVVPQAPKVQPVYLPGFKHITTSDFVDSEGSVMPSQTYNSPASFYMAERDSFDKTLLSLKLKYLSGDSDDRIEMAGTTNNSGFILYPNSTGTQLWFNVLVWDENAMVASPGNYFYIAFSATDAEISSFINNEFIFQLSFEYGEFNGDHSNDDMRLGFYINGKRCQDTDGNSEIIIPGCIFEKFGDCLNVGQYDQYITVESVVPQAPKVQPVYLEGFRNITTSSFVDGTGYQMENKRYEVPNSFFMKDMQGNTNGSFDRTLLSLKLKYEAASNASRIEVAGKDASNGFMLYVGSEGKRLRFNLVNWSTPMANVDTFPIDILAEQAEVYNFLDDEFLFQMSMEYGNYDTDDLEDDMRVGFYINGKLYGNQHHIIPDCKFEELFGNCLTVRADIGAITVGSVVPMKEEMTPLTWSDYVEAGTHVKATDRLFPVSEFPSVYHVQNPEIVNMEDTAFEARITFEKSMYGNEIRFAGTNEEYGMFLLVGSDGNLWLSTSDRISPNLGLTDVLVFDKTVAGVDTFLDKEFTLKITTEFADYDGDGDANDVQLGFYLDDTLYNDQYLYGYDCKEEFGPYLTIYSTSGSVIIRDDYELKFWNLWSDGNYEIKAEDDQQVFINGEESRERTISIPGDYLIQVGEDGTTHKVAIYSEKDAHPDDALDIRDLVATVKVSQGVSLDTWAGNLGVNEAGADAGAVRERLLHSMNIEESDAVSFDFMGEDVMPLAGFCGPHRSYDDVDRGNTAVRFENFLTEDWMRIISEAGINLIAHADPDYASTAFPGEVEKLLKYGSKYGVGLFVSDSGATTKYSGNDIAIPVDSLRERINNYSIYDAFCGLFVIDEPKTDYYPLKEDGSSYNGDEDLKKYISAYGNISNVLQHDLDIPCYLNMFPYWTQKEYHTKGAYERYVKEFCETLQPKILMWDYYPFDAHDDLSVYFYNMDIVRKYADRYDIPFWAAIQAGGQWNDKKVDLESVTPYYPNREQFNWNVNTCLAYGVQGLDYFPLIQPVHFAYEPEDGPNNGYDFSRNGLIGANGFNKEGKLNQWYYYAQDINKHIKAMDHVLMNSENMGLMLNVKEAGKRAEKPDTFLNTTTYDVPNFLADFDAVEDNYILSKGVDDMWSTKNNFLSVSESREDGPNATWREVTDVTGNAMIGCFNYNGKTALYVVNYDMEATQPITIHLDENKTHHVRTIREGITTYDIVQNNNIELTMTAGEGVLFVIE